MVAAIQASAKKYKHVGYNKAALALLKLGAMTLKIPCKAVEAVIAISPDDQLLLPCYHFAQTGVPINGNCTTSIANPKRWKIPAISR